ASTSSDWAFLFSDRSAPYTGQTGAGKKSPLPSTLPARDPDLIQFVGREGPMSELRHWFTDKRSPVRLVTGIGGLGKTTLAYQFAAEVSDAAAGEVEQVIWLTAKAQTYSVLRGELVTANRVDFSDMATLLFAILKVLKHEPSF